jgi:hypothetical protein
MGRSSLISCGYADQVDLVRLIRSVARTGDDALADEQV